MHQAAARKSASRNRHSSRSMYSGIGYLAEEVLSFGDQAGYLMIMPYLFACVAEGLHRVFERRGAPSGAYVVPVSTDLRRAKDIREELFFNRNSMFFFQLKPGDVVDRKRLVGSIKTQMYEQVQIKFPEGLMAASALTRIAPLSLLRKIFHLPLEAPRPPTRRVRSAREAARRLRVDLVRPR